MAEQKAPDAKAPADKAKAQEPSKTFSGAPGGDVSARALPGTMPPPDDPLSTEPQAAASTAGNKLYIVKEGTNFKPYKPGDVVYLTPLQQQQWADRFDPAPADAKPTQLPAPPVYASQLPGEAPHPGTPHPGTPLPGTPHPGTPVPGTPHPAPHPTEHPHTEHPGTPRST